MEKQIDLTPDETFEMFKKEEEKETTLEDLAKELGIELDQLVDLSLDEVAELSEQKAKQKSIKIKKHLDKRHEALNVFRTAQNEAGITNNDMTKIYFEDLKKGPEN